MGIRTAVERLVAAGEADAGPAPRRAVALPSLRPYLPSRRHLRRILRGLVVLVRMAWKAVRAGLRRATEQPKPKGETVEKPVAKGEKSSEKKDDAKAAAMDALERAGAAVLTVLVVLAAAAGVAHLVWSGVRPYVRTVAGVAVVGLLTAAWIVGPDKPGEKHATPGEPRAGGEAAVEPAPLPHVEQLLDAHTIAATVRQIAVPRGWQGAHLDDVLAHLPGVARADLLAALAEARIPVAEQLKLTLPGGRQRNRQGVRLDALPGRADEAAPAPPKGPAQAPAEAAPEPAPPAPYVTVYGAE